MIKLSGFARQHNISYRTANRWFKAGLIKGKQMPTGTILIEEETSSTNLPLDVIIYTRVSSSENKKNLEAQAKRLTDYCIAKRYRIVHIIKEVGSGVNDTRRLFLKLLTREDYGKIVVEHKDRLTRFGFLALKTLLEKSGRTIEVVNEKEDAKEDLVEDLVAIITSFCARIYGLRRSQRKTEKIVKELLEDVKKDNKKKH